MNPAAKTGHKAQQALAHTVGAATFDVFIAALVAQPEHDVDAAFCDAIEAIADAAEAVKHGKDDQ